MIKFAVSLYIDLYSETKDYIPLVILVFTASNKAKAIEMTGDIIQDIIREPTVLKDYSNSSDVFDPTNTPNLVYHDPKNIKMITVNSIVEKK